MLIRQAGVVCSWSAPPDAAGIRAMDHERLLADPILTERPHGDEAEQARKLLEGRSAEDVAAALIRLYQARLPAPTEIFDALPRRGVRTEAPREQRDQRFPRDAQEIREPREQREPRAPREGFTGTGWFRVNVGRHQNADPKWLLPMICRIGDVTRTEIGAIRVLDRETKFEIAADAVEHFRAAIAAAGDAEYRFAPADGAPGPQDAGKRDFAPRGEGKRPFFRGGDKGGDRGGFKGKRRAS
jgi:ATP-dependent RNA helicase DeaD